MKMHYDRRRFLRNTISAALGGASVYSMLGQLQLAQAATSSYTFSDYRALVCVFLYGGNDAFNNIAPIDAAHYAQYKAVRPSIALAQNQLIKLNAPASGAGSPGDGGTYGMHPGMPELATLFNQSQSPLAIVANVGSLVGPTSKQGYASNSAALPPQLFSHADQEAYWQSCPPSNTPVTGWGGRICDLLAAANPSGIPILTSLTGEDVFLRGQNVNGYIMNADSAPVLDFPWDEGNKIGTAFSALHASGTQANALERTYAATMNHARATADLINKGLGATGIPDFAAYFPNPSGYDLDTQLKTVAKLIWAVCNNVTGFANTRRQVFFVSVGGFDTHSDETTQLATVLPLLSKSLSGFYRALQSVGLQNKATLFTASDFGRTLSANANGTDHGWGGHHYVLGGAVAGGKFYGDNRNGSGTAAMPSLALSDNNADDAGYGQIIPTTSIDQYSATLANWFGLSSSDIALLHPNLSNFSTRNLGFV
ncbi:MAG: DUF1501 domain-containing protein [Gammaproteobacteria bacterium]|nr:MAG: DUF1501 domain-containing protein [Gammaproteobacteria bacterium]